MFFLLGERWMISFTTLEVEVDRLMTFRQVFKEIAVSIYIYNIHIYLCIVYVFIYLKYIYIHMEMYIHIIYI